MMCMCADISQCSHNGRIIDRQHVRRLPAHHTVRSDQHRLFRRLVTRHHPVEHCGRFVPQPFIPLGTDGMGRSESRAALRRHFEVDAELIVLATLYQLKDQGKCDGQCVANAIKDLGIDPEKQSALYA